MVIGLFSFLLFLSICTFYLWKFPFHLSFQIFWLTIVPKYFLIIFIISALSTEDYIPLFIPKFIYLWLLHSLISPAVFVYFITYFSKNHLVLLIIAIIFFFQPFLPLSLKVSFSYFLWIHSAMLFKLPKLLFIFDLDNMSETNRGILKSSTMTETLLKFFTFLAVFI